MKTAYRTGSYAGKSDRRAASLGPGAMPVVSAGRGRGHGKLRAPRLTSPVISQATQNVGLTIYELLGMAELMRVAYEKGELESVHNRLSLLVTEAADLASSISDILDLQKIETDRDCAVSEQFDLIALLHEVTEAARSFAGDKAITVMDASCPGTVVIHSDPSKIRQIMTGLVNNAVKFTDRGRIAVIMSRDDGELKLTVADTWERNDA